MAKRRILHKLKMTEISAVDRPCQEGAKMTIMKRADDLLLAPSGQTDALSDRIKKAQQQMDGMALLKQLDDLSDQLDTVIAEFSPANDAIARADRVLNKEWSEEAREAALAARRGQHHASNIQMEDSKGPPKPKKKQPKRRWLKAAGLATIGSPALAAAYLYSTRRSKYEKALATAGVALAKYDPDQKRDESGRWASSGGVSPHRTAAGAAIRGAASGAKEHFTSGEAWRQVKRDFVSIYGGAAAGAAGGALGGGLVLGRAGIASGGAAGLVGGAVGGTLHAMVNQIKDLAGGRSMIQSAFREARASAKEHKAQRRDGLIKSDTSYKSELAALTPEQRKVFVASLMRQMKDK